MKTDSLYDTYNLFSPKLWREQIFFTTHYTYVSVILPSGITDTTNFLLYYIFFLQDALLSSKAISVERVTAFGFHVVRLS